MAHSVDPRQTQEPLQEGMQQVTVQVALLSPHAKLPKRATEGSAYYDVYAAEPFGLYSHTAVPVHTGLALAVPPGYFLDIRPRSGLALKGVEIMNSPGVLDSDYRGELVILLIARQKSDAVGMLFKEGERVAQVAVLPVSDIDWQVVAELPPTERGTGGMGSTGR